MWTEITRAQYRRDELRYASDTRAAEWAQIAPLLPIPSRLGRPREWGLRAIVDAILYLLWTGCPWRRCPGSFRPIRRYRVTSTAGATTGTWERVSRVLVAQARRQVGRDPMPSVGIIDSQSVPTTESGGPRGVDAGKRIKGRKRHIVTDTEGFLLAVACTKPIIQDPHGAVALLRSLRQRFPELRHIFADRVYCGEQLLNAIADCGPWTIEIVQRPPGVKGLQLLPRRWVVERSLAWLGRSRRLAKDFEASIASATAWLLVANLRLLSRRLARA